MGGGVGDGDADSDLAVSFAEDGLDVEGLEQFLGQARRGLGQDVAEDGQGIQQGRVGDLGGGDIELVALGFQGFLLDVEFAVAGPDPLAQRGGGGVAGVGGGLQLGDEGLLGGGDLGQLLVQSLSLSGAAGGFLLGVGGELCLQRGWWARRADR